MTPTAITSRIRPLAAARSLVRVLRDPDDLDEIFRLLAALSGRTPQKIRRRLEGTRAGERLLQRQPALLPRLRDHAALAQLPEGSLGRAYLRFMQRDGLTAEALVHASTATDDPVPADPTDAYVGDRLRDSHDLWHVVTGYGGDLLGEAALLAFTWAQTRAAGIGLLTIAALVRADDPDARALILDGLVRGLKAAWLPAVAWEDLLADDLDSVRAKLRVGAPPSYEPFFSHELPTEGLLAHRAA